jgi:hypothetical protein
MFMSMLSAVVFAVVFTVTAVYALLRFARMSSGAAAPAGDRLVELFHLLMSVAMVGMAVGWTGGPGTPRGIVQIVVFGAFTLWFAARAASGTADHGRMAGVQHVVMSAAMTWMVAAMPLMTGMSMAGETSSEHAAHGGAGEAAGMGAMEPDAAAPAWVTAVSVVFIALLLAAACWWLARLLRGDGADAAEAADGAGGTATRTSIPTLARVDIAAHVLMSLGMAGMLVTLL